MKENIQFIFRAMTAGFWFEFTFWCGFIALLEQNLLLSVIFFVAGGISTAYLFCESTIIKRFIGLIISVITFRTALVLITPLCGFGRFIHNEQSAFRIILKIMFIRMPLLFAFFLEFTFFIIGFVCLIFIKSYKEKVLPIPPENLCQYKKRQFQAAVVLMTLYLSITVGLIATK